MQIVFCGEHIPWNHIIIGVATYVGTAKYISVIKTHTFLEH